jgi:peptide/nickel transport system ATP-binding protein
MAGSGTAHLRGGDAMLLVQNLVVEFPSGRGRRVRAVSDLSFDVARGETLGLVGESGCGKTTTGRAILQLPPPTGGTVTFEGRDLTRLKAEELRRVRPRLQMIFQDPVSSLNPRRKIRDIVREPLRVWRRDEAGAAAKVDATLEAVGLDPARVGDRLPSQLSGGQCQRVSIARALMYGAELLVCDEPVSALDVSVQAQILNLLEATKADFGLTLVFIAHDLAVVKNISDRVAVMYLGKLCEIGPSEAIYANPQHPYTAALMAAVPVPDPEVVPVPLPISGELPSPLDPPSGCRFRTRCPRAQDLCAQQEPIVQPAGDGHFVACHFPVDGSYTEPSSVI